MIKLFFSEHCGFYDGSFYKAIIIPNRKVICFEESMSKMLEEFSESFGYNYYIEDFRKREQQKIASFDNNDDIRVMLHYWEKKQS